MRVTFVQFAGDYREAVNRLRSGGQENYYAQRHSVDLVGSLVGRCESVAVICCLTGESYDEVAANGVRVIGCGFSSKVDQRAVVRQIVATSPDRLILRTPMTVPLQWAKTKKVATITSLADSFSGKRLRDRLRSLHLARLLNARNVDWVFNHGLNSCLSLRRIGVSPEKIVPWDWPAVVTPRDEVKTLRNDGTLTLFFAGLVSEAKGLGDVLQALTLLGPELAGVCLRIAGPGDVDRFAGMAAQLGIADRVRFLGQVSHDTVLTEMQQADVVIVPSRHEYPEGFPMTIYETLCSRTPLVASDHPMFRTNLTENECLTFPAGNSHALARCLQQLLTDPALYRRLSEGSREAWNRLQLPVKWEDTILRWIFDSAENRAWFFAHRLSSGRYPLQRYELAR
jgi:glycosyltransferase involved in cell wall biosynthesis